MIFPMTDSAASSIFGCAVRRRGMLFLGCAGAALILSLVCARAESAPQALTEMYHSSWTIREGAPSSIEAIAQTVDGFLWLGTDSGLYRFDGKTFERYHPTSGDDLLPGTIPSLMATPDGGLWVGYAFVGASFLKDGHNVNFGKADGLTSGYIRQFARDQAGTIWAAANTGLRRYDGSIWKTIDSNWGGAEINHASAVFIDSRGTVWANCGTGLLYLTRGSSRFQTALAHTGDQVQISEASDGSVWAALAETSSVEALTDAEGQMLEHPKVLNYSANGLLFTSDGSLWLATDSHGLYRLPPQMTFSTQLPDEPVIPEHFSSADGLTSDHVGNVLVDREGGTWVVGARGLDHFRRSALTPISLPENWSRIAIVATGPDSILVAGKGIKTLDRAGVATDKGALKEVTTAYRDPQGTIWIGEADGLWQYSSGGLKPVPLPAGLDPLFHIAQTMTMDRRGGLWISFLHTGFMYYLHGKWSKPSFPSAAAHDPGLTAYTDSHGRVWFGMKESRLEVLSDAQQIRYGPESGVAVGDVAAIYERSGQVWLGGGLGLQFLKDNRFRSLHLAGDAQIEGVSGIIQLASGELWVNQSSGVLRIAADEVKRVLQEPEYRVRFALYDYLDGLMDSANQIRPNPTLIQTDSGRIYISTHTGVVWIDPVDVPAAPAPEVFVKSLTVNDTVHRNAKNLQLPVHAGAIKIEYTATSLLIPERVRFTYKLEGFDQEWQDAGTRRQAFYSGLPPGRYTFRVRACNSDGVWNEDGAALGFEIPPSFLQSLPFKTLCAIAAAAFLALLYHLRVRLVLRQVRTRLYERLTERERIARDLHDTFFQAIQGLLLRFNTGTSLLKRDEPARVILDEALAQSDRVMLEGRELLLDLRTGTGEGTGSLSEAFASAEADLRAIRSAEFKVSVHGDARELHPVVFEEMYRLGREALFNAFRHACAACIEADVIYETNTLRLRFRDNGIGIDPAILSDGRANHWGLAGMRERARKIGAQMDIWSRAGAGTEIEVRIPATVAYSKNETRRASRWSALRVIWKEHEVQ